MRVIVTRPRAQAEELVEALRSAGFEPVLCPLIEIEPIDDGPIDVDGYDWVIVTSANGAAELARRHAGAVPRIAAVGEATAAALAEHGLEAALVPSISSQEGLLAELPRPVGRALFVGAAGARRLIADELPADFRAVYRTVELTPEAPDRRSRPARVAVGGSGVGEARAATCRDHDRAPDDGGRPLAGLDVVAEAGTQDVAGLVDSAAAWRASSRS